MLGFLSDLQIYSTIQQRNINLNPIMVSLYRQCRPGATGATGAMVAPVLLLSVTAGRAGGGAVAWQVTEGRSRDSTGLIITVRLIELLGVITTAAESLVPWACVQCACMLCSCTFLFPGCDFDTCKLLLFERKRINISALCLARAFFVGSIHLSLPVCHSPHFSHARAL